MSRLEWIPGPSPLNLSPLQIENIIELFLSQTGEVYSVASVMHLPIPQWEGNLLLVDHDLAEPRPIQGVFWSTPFKDDIVRVAAFVIQKEHQGQGYGGQAWTTFQHAAIKAGYKQVQLEVKASNHGAQRFYSVRGLKIQQPLVGYYQSGLGFMMRGPIHRSP